MTIFAYSVRPDWARKLNEDCNRVREEQHQCQRLIFVSTASMTAGERDSATRRVRDNFGWELELYGLERLRVRLVGDLHYLIAQHPAIFAPPFFPTAGGLSISESRDTLIIDHALQDHALAAWLSRRLQLAGYRTWSYGTAPLAGETPDDTVRTLIARRAALYIPLMSDVALSEVDFVARCGLACSVEHLVLPCQATVYDPAKLPSKMARLSVVRFDGSWRDGLANLLEVLASRRLNPALATDQGRAIALRSYVPESVTRATPEGVHANVFAVTVPAAIQVCDLLRPLTEQEQDDLRKVWAYVEADARTLLAFDDPPSSVPLRSGRRAEYASDTQAYIHGKRSIDAVKELIRRSLDIMCLRAGLVWCTDRRVFYFPHEGTSPQRRIWYYHVDQRRTFVAATGEKTYGAGASANPFRYQLAPSFRVGRDDGGRWWATLRIYVRVTTRDGAVFSGKDIIRRRKTVTKSWWNKEWFARTLAVMQALSCGQAAVSLGSGNRSVTVATTPLTWSCPISIDYLAVERIGDFQDEIAQLRYVADHDDDSDRQERTDD